MPPKRRGVTAHSADGGFAKAIAMENKRLRSKIDEYLDENPEEMAQWHGLMISGTMKRGKRGHLNEDDDTQGKPWGRSQQRFKNTSLAFQKELFFHCLGRRLDVDGDVAQHILAWAFRISKDTWLPSRFVERTMELVKLVYMASGDRLCWTPANLNFEDGSVGFFKFSVSQPTMLSCPSTIWPDVVMPFGLRFETTENSVNSLKIENNWDLKAAVIMNDQTGHMFVAYKQFPGITAADLEGCFEELPGDERGEVASPSSGPDDATTPVGDHSPADDSPRPAVARRSTAAVSAAPVAAPASLASSSRVAALPS